MVSGPPLLAEAERTAGARGDVRAETGPGPTSRRRGARRGEGWIGWAPFRRESRNGVQILRAQGTTFRPRRFAGRAANYLSYFLSACWAALRVPRPDVVVSLTDPPVVGLAALLAARRSRAGFVFLCQDIFPEVAGLVEDFRSDAVNWLLERINRLVIREADRIVAVGETMRDRLVAEKGALETLLGAVPTSVIDALARNDVLQIVVFSLLLGLAVNAAGGPVSLEVALPERDGTSFLDLLEPGPRFEVLKGRSRLDSVPGCWGRIMVRQ